MADVACLSVEQSGETMAVCSAVGKAGMMVGKSAVRSVERMAASWADSKAVTKGYVACYLVVHSGVTTVVCWADQWAATTVCEACGSAQWLDAMKVASWADLTVATLAAEAYPWES
jgi:hypothetical protein